MYTTLQKWGGSQGVRLPKQIIDEVSLAPGSEVEVTVRGDEIIIRKRRKYSSMTELFAGYKGDIKAPGYEWGDDVGKEREERW